MTWHGEEGEGTKGTGAGFRMMLCMQILSDRDSWILDLAVAGLWRDWWSTTRGGVCQRLTAVSGL
jgi:hypothetical protein